MNPPAPDICLMAPCRPQNGSTRLVRAVTCPRCLQLLRSPVFADLFGLIEQLRRADTTPAA